jgi:surface polysaccharide O-acyltransferase-like enzyme
MNQRILSIEYIRGLAMLGVVGIHTGSELLSNPQANIHLFAVLEIVSRFSVPIFFFVSAFSLFHQYPLDGPFDAGRFYRRRFVRVLLPYLIGSVLYMLHYSWLTGDWSIWLPILVYQFFGFGMASYQLYFLVILLWFYLLMPLWRPLTRRILEHPILWLGLLFAGQIAFNYYSSYKLRPNSGLFYLDLLIQYRMSWWLAHYLFLFLFGAVFAVRYEEIMNWLRRCRQQVSLFFFLSLGLLLAHYYYLLLIRHYSLEQSVNTVHQLSPGGTLYTLAACLYLMLRFDGPLPFPLQSALNSIGRHSYGIFWIHTLFIHYLSQGLTALGWSMTVPVTVLFYAATVLSSLGAVRLWLAARRRLFSQQEG